MPTLSRARTALTDMRKILRATDSYAKELSGKSGLTTSQLLLLQVLEEHGESTAGEIANYIGITQATTTILIQKLEQRELIQRQRGNKDRRKVWLSLTQSGEEALSAAPNGLQEQFIKGFEALESWEQSMILAALERILTLLNAEDIDAAPVLDVGEIDRDQH